MAQTAKAAVDQGQVLAQEAAGQAQRTGAAAAERGQQVVGAAAERAQDLVGTVREETARVSEEVSSQVQSLAAEATDQLETQAQEAAHRLSQGFRQLGQETQALAEGRPSDAPNLREYVLQAADRLYSTAEGFNGVAASIEQRGIEGLVEDVQVFARRRPAAFLIGAAAAGFVIGRAVRSGSRPSEATSGDGAAQSVQPPPQRLPGAVRGDVRPLPTGRL